MRLPQSFLCVPLGGGLVPIIHCVEIRIRLFGKYAVLIGTAHLAGWAGSVWLADQFSTDIPELILDLAPTLKSFEPTAKIMGSSNRAFGLVFCIFFALIGLSPVVHHAASRTWALIIAGVCGVLAIAYPRILAGPNRLWTRFGLLLHAVTSPMALFLIYVVAVVPVGLLMRLAGKDPMRRNYDPACRSYWIPRNPPGRPDTGLRNQY